MVDIGYIYRFSAVFLYYKTLVETKPAGKIKKSLYERNLILGC